MIFVQQFIPYILYKQIRTADISHTFWEYRSSFYDSQKAVLFFCNNCRINLHPQDDRAGIAERFVPVHRLPVRAARLFLCTLRNDILHLRPVFFHMADKLKLRPSAVEVVPRTMNLEVFIAIQMVR